MSRCYPPATGGMERFAFDVHESLKTKEQLITTTWGGSRSLLPIVLPYFFIRAFWQLLTRKIDIIHAQDGVVSILLMPLTWLFRRPMVVVIHGLDVTYKLSLYQFLIRRALARSAKVICISSAAAAQVTSRGVPADKIQVIPLGVTDDLFMDDKAAARQAVQSIVPGFVNQRLLLSSGRLVERKGLEWFVRSVMPGLVKKFPDIMLVISGDGPKRQAIATAATEQGIGDAVRLLGRTTDEELKYLYNAADCFVMPNYVVPGDMEGFGRVVVEAALCQVPVVASGIEGITDAIIDGKNGQLVPTLDAEAYRQAVQNVVSQPKAAQAARAYSLKTFAWSTISRRYQAVYEEVTS